MSWGHTFVRMSFKINNKIRFIIIIIIIFFLYYSAFNYLEEKKYNELPENWYHGGIYTYDCVTVNGVFMEINTQRSTTTNHISFQSNCKKDFAFYIRHPNTTKVYYKVNSSLIKGINLTDNNQVEITFNSNSIEKYGHYSFDIDTENIFDFYAYYSIVTPDTNPQKIVFVFDSSKYSCGDCIDIISKDNLENERGIFYRETNRAVKTFFIKGENQFLFRFNPQNKKIIFIQKILDSVLLGLIATLLYVLLFGKRGRPMVNEDTKLKKKETNIKEKKGFFKWYQSKLSSEEDIEIRKRQEEYLKWIAGIILTCAIALYGWYLIELVAQKGMKFLLIRSFSIILLLLIFYIYSWRIIPDYHEITNGYIRDSKRKNKKSS